MIVEPSLCQLKSGAHFQGLSEPFATRGRALKSRNRNQCHRTGTRTCTV